MRITKKTSSNLDIAQVISKINKRQQQQQSSINNQYESGSKFDKNQKSFLLEKEKLINGDPIKVQLVKNNQNKKVYSTKTIDYKTFYKQGIMNRQNINENNDLNYQLKKSTNNIQRQNYKITTESNDDHFHKANAYNDKTNYNNNNNKYSDLGNIDRLKKYLIPRNNPYRNSLNMNTNINRPRVISASPVPSNPYLRDELDNENSNNNYRKNKNQQEHKMRDLLSQKFTYNKPKTTSTPNNIKKKPHNYDLKTYWDNNRNNFNNSDNISVNSFNYNKKDKYKKNKDNISVISYDESNSMINHKKNFLPEIKLDDLIIYDERLNDILVALNNYNYEPDASNECAEFFVFYFHSSLQKSFPLFFNAKNKIVIESANNLTLLAIIITYHLSILKDILKDVLNMVMNIFSLLKMNLYLTTKKIQISYGDAFVEKNNFYFKTFNYYLRTQNLINIKEDDIIFKIDHNCRLVTNDLKKIIKIYQQINNIFYTDFFALFNNISVLAEKDLKDYFYARLYGFMNQNKTDDKNLTNSKNRKISITKSGKNANNINSQLYNKNNGNNGNYGIDSDYNNENNNNLDNADVISVKSSKSSHYYGKIDKHNFKILKLLEEYEKNKIEPPFIKTPCKKKYTIVLDLDETLINIQFKEIESNKCILRFRPGLFSFLSDIKPFCELITFTSASKEYAQPIINEIELKNKYFDYNFFREHSIICGNDFVKDISRIGRDMKKIIIVDNMRENFRLNLENGIKIAPFNGNENDNDNVLNELKKIIIMIYKQGYEDLTLALKDYSNEIKKKISLET